MTVPAKKSSSDPAGESPRADKQASKWETPGEASARTRWARSAPWALMLSVLFFGTAAGRYCWLMYGPASWGPRFACDESHIDVGNIAPERVIKHDFVVRNTGRQSLKLVRIAPDCAACLRVAASANEVQPGQACRIHVTLDASLLSQGPFRKAVLVMTNDPHLARVVLVVHGAVTQQNPGSF
jgi:Protein of unknown function (DUF1573)